jgi:hypothetical protein
MTKLDRWMKAYTHNLARELRMYPDECVEPSGDTVESMSEKMRGLFASGLFNKDSPAIRATCKQIGIEYTHKAINEFIGPRPDRPMTESVNKFS